MFLTSLCSRSIQMSLSVLLLGVGVATVTDLQLNAVGSILSLLAIITTCIAQIVSFQQQLLFIFHKLKLKCLIMFFLYLVGFAHIFNSISYFHVASLGVLVFQCSRRQRKASFHSHQNMRSNCCYFSLHCSLINKQKVVMI